MDLRRQDGVALIIAMMSMLLLTALGVALVLTTSTETMITANYRNGQEALYAADAVVERAMDDVLTVKDWNTLLNGAVQSAFIDGDKTGTRMLADGSTITLDEVVNLANCRKVATCTSGEMDAVTAERPWGVNNPRWQLYAYGNLGEMLPTDTINSPYYAIVLVGDDGSETDGNPAQDGASQGNGIIALRAEAFGPRGSHKVIELTVARTDTTELERGYTGQRGQDEQNRRARKSAVQTPGKGLTMQSLTLSTGVIQ